MVYNQSKIAASIVTTIAATGVMLATPSIAEASFGERTLKLGMDHSDIVILQEKLKEKGYFNHHTATGYFGQITRQAVQDFQRANKLTPDGIVGPKTFALIVQYSEQPKEKSTTEKVETKTNTTTNSTKTTTESKGTSVDLKQLQTSKTLRVGSRGTEVEKLQLYLKKAGFFNHDTATGYYGTVTDQGVRRFQQARGLKVDGIAGPQTLAAVNKEIGNTTTATSTKTPSNNNDQTSNPTTNSKTLVQSNVILRQGSQGELVKTLQFS